MRLVFAVLAAAALFIPAAQAEPLAPGKPAGVRAARLSTWNEAVMLGTGALILTAVGIVASHHSAAITSEHFDSNAVPFQPTTVSTGTGG
jgi:hypothetical protein